MPNILTIDQVREVFPEARESYASDHEEFTIHCLCPKRARYKVSINAENGAYYCHKCTKAGNGMKDYFNNAAKYFPGLSIQRPPPLPETGREKKRYDIMWGKENNIPAPGQCVMIDTLPEDHPAIQYLLARGFSVKKIINSGFYVLYCKKGQMWLTGSATTSGRIIFPVMKNNDVVGWQARQIDVVSEDKLSKRVWRGEEHGWKDYTRSSPQADWPDKDVPKYYTCPGMSRSLAVFNFDNAREASKLVVVVEGPVDALAVGRHAIATIGKAVTADQIKIIKANWTHVVLIQDDGVLNDPDPTKVKKYKALLEEISKGVAFKTFALKGYDDPGSCPTEEIWKQIFENISGDPEFSQFLNIANSQARV